MKKTLTACAVVLAAWLPLGVRAQITHAQVGAASQMKPQLVPSPVVSRPAPYPINDTGQTPAQCFQANSNALVSCQSTQASSLNSQQDGMTGRDVKFPDNSDGRLGFSFTKMSSTGTLLSASATSWACVKDNVTGLVWENKTADGGIHDRNNTYKVDGWDHDASTLVTATNAEHLCGFSDWRLPDWFELNGLLNYGATSAPAIDTAYFSNMPVTTYDKYWSSTHDDDVAGAGVYQFAVDFKTAASGQTPMAGQIYVRLVHGAALPSANRFVVSANKQEVTDTVMGLVWRRCLEGMAWNGTTCSGTPAVYTHGQALAHAQTQAGWRMPNIKEVESIVDRGNASPGWSATLFPGTPVLNTSTQPDYWQRRPATATAMPLSIGNFAMISIGYDQRDNDGMGRGEHYLRLVRDVPATGAVQAGQQQQ